MRRIKVIYDNKEEIFLKTKLISEKFNITVQQILNILKGKTKNKCFIYDNKLVYLEYIDPADEEEKTDRQKRKEYNKRAYLKRKNKLE